MPPDLVFLGTGAAGGTPGEGRSRRRESSAVVRSEISVLIDVTRHFADQADALDGIDAILLTHAHRDASGGLAQLRRWWRKRGNETPIPVHAHLKTLEVVEERYARLDHIDRRPVEPGARFELGGWSVVACEVPHTEDERFPTLAWRLDQDGHSLVYASDTSRLSDDLEELAAGASLLVLDGAFWGRRFFTHLTIDEDLPVVCGWDVARILLTQIGKTAPPHDELAQEVREICERAEPAHDRLVVDL